MDELKDYNHLPRQEDVTTINMGPKDIHVVKVTDENASYLAQIALSMYANEPCRVCGKLLTMDDLRNGAVYATYSADSTSRAAHKDCWERSPIVDGVVPKDWVHQ